MGGNNNDDDEQNMNKMMKPKPSNERPDRRERVASEKYKIVVVSVGYVVIPTHVRSSVGEKLAKTSAAVIGPTAPAVASKEMVTKAANNMMHTTPAAANAATEEVIGGLRFLLDSVSCCPTPFFPTSGSGGSSKGAASSLIFNEDYSPRPRVHVHCTMARVATETPDALGASVDCRV